MTQEQHPEQLLLPFHPLDILPAAPAPRRRSAKIQPWADEPFHTARNEQSLWAAVITQALMDALCKWQSADAKVHRDRAARWLMGNSQDFVMVCHLAGFEPEDVRRRAKKALAKPVEWRAAPRKGKRYIERKTYRERQKARRSAPDDRPAQILYFPSPK